MSESLNRRSLIIGLASLVAAPAIVRVSSLMPVRRVPTVVFDAAFQIRYRKEAIERFASYDLENSFACARSISAIITRDEFFLIVRDGNGLTVSKKLNGWAREAEAVPA